MIPPSLDWTVRDERGVVVPVRAKTRREAIVRVALARADEDAAFAADPWRVTMWSASGRPMEVRDEQNHTW